MELLCDSTPPASVLALTSALLFAIGIHLTRVGMRHTEPRTATLITIGSATVLYWLASPLFLQWSDWRSPAVLLFAAIGLFRPVLSANLAMAGTYRLGPTIASTVAATAPLFGVAFGVALLGETLGPATAAGTVAIVAGVMMLSWRGQARHDWAAWALLLPIGAALLRTLAQGLAKVGMEVLPDPFFVGLVGYSVSLAVAALAHRGRRAGADPRARIAGPGFKWLALTGCIYGLSILSLNTALACGRMVMVAPVVACSPLFTLLLGVAVFDERRITRRTVAAVLMVVPGVVLVSLRG